MTCHDVPDVEPTHTTAFDDEIKENDLKLKRAETYATRPAHDDHKHLDIWK